MQPEKVAALQLQVLQKALFLLQILPESVLPESTGAQILMQRTSGLRVERACKNKIRPRLVQERRCGLRVLPLPAGARPAEDHIGRIIHARRPEALQLPHRFRGGVSLVHIPQRVVKAALHAHVQLIDPQVPEPFQLIVRLIPDVQDRRVHGDDLCQREIFMDHLRDPCKTFCTETESVPVFQEDPPGGGEELPCLF